MWIVALLEKEEVISALSLVGGPDLFQVRNYSGRDGSMFYGQPTPNVRQANEQFREAVAKSVDQGWRVIHFGPPKYG